LTAFAWAVSDFRLPTSVTWNDIGPSFQIGRANVRCVPAGSAKLPVPATKSHIAGWPFCQRTTRSSSTVSVLQLSMTTAARPLQPSTPHLHVIVTSCARSATSRRAPHATGAGATTGATSMRATSDVTPH